MRVRYIGIMLAALVFSVAVGPECDTLATAASKKRSSLPAFLSRAYLQGSMQGKSGAVLDLNGDGHQDLAIGAPYARHRGTTGAVLVYHGTGNGFRKRPDAVIKGEGNLGWSLVSLGGDLFAAGAYSGSGDNVSLSGTVSVYGGDGVPQKRVTLEGDDAMDRFGYALAAGDLDHDGAADLIVGAPLHSSDPAFYQMGAVYIYFGPAFDPADRLKIPAAEDREGIGFSLATGDLNADGKDDLLMEAAGKVVGFYGGETFSKPGDFDADPEVVFYCGDRGFGRSLAVIPDVDDDGFNDLAVGAYQAAIGNTDTGRLFILKGGAGSRDVDLDAAAAASEIISRIDGEANCGQFAAAILPVKEMGGGDLRYLAVSAVHADGNPWPMTGKIFIFNASALNADTTVDSAIAIPGEARDMHLGTFLALIKDKMWLVAGAPTERANTGSVRLFDLEAVSQ